MRNFGMDTRRQHNEYVSKKILEINAPQDLMDRRAEWIDRVLSRLIGAVAIAAAAALITGIAWVWWR